MSGKKIYKVLLALVVAAVLFGGAAYAGNHLWKRVGKNESNETMIVSVTGKLSECKWNDVTPVYPDQFEGSPAAFVAFRKGYHYLGLCPESTLNVNVLEYDNARQASIALDAAKRSIASAGNGTPPETTLVKVGGRRLKMVKVRESEGGLLYIAMWNSSNKVLFLEEETPPSVPEGKALKQMQPLLEGTYRLYKP